LSCRRAENVLSFLLQSLSSFCWAQAAAASWVCFVYCNGKPLCLRGVWNIIKSFVQMCSTNSSRKNLHNCYIMCDCSWACTVVTGGDMHKSSHALLTSLSKESRCSSMSSWCSCCACGSKMQQSLQAYQILSCLACSVMYNRASQFSLHYKPPACRFASEVSIMRNLYVGAASCNSYCMMSLYEASLLSALCKHDFSHT
jgi:hypothetical protein